MASHSPINVSAVIEGLFSNESISAEAVLVSGMVRQIEMIHRIFVCKGSAFIGNC